MKKYKSICYLLALLICPTMFCSAPAKVSSPTPQDHEVLIQELFEKFNEIGELATESEKQVSSLTATQIAQFITGFQGAFAAKRKLIKIQTNISQFKNNQTKDVMNAWISEAQKPIDRALEHTTTLISLLQSKFEEDAGQSLKRMQEKIEQKKQL